MKVLVVDDSAFMRRALTQMLTSDPAINVVGTARNGREAVDMAKGLKPDVITLDIEMPQMDGLTALRHIMRQSPTQVLMLSSLTTEGSHAALTALRLGAADVLAKDVSQISLAITNIQDDLLARVRALGSQRCRRRFGADQPSDASRHRHTVPVLRPGQFDVICIGSSTGGPPVLETLLAAVPGSMKTPIVIAQHMPRVFTESMAQRLDDVCPLTVRHTEDGMPMESGTVYIAPGGKNIHLRKRRLAQWELRVNDEPATAIYRPSVDALLASAAQSTGSRTLVIILTGMGEDGLVGARALHARGGMILAQSEETCVVYGMPKAVTQSALIAASLAPDQLAQVLSKLSPTAAATTSA